MIDLYHNDCLKQMRQMKDCSVDSIVTDPPYGLSFMARKWDYDVPSQEIWEECLRVLKPGGYLLAFAGSRTYHRIAVRIEDAGFEIRDQIMWVYGSGFPKSLDIGKAIEGKQWKGWGTALKPAHEPIVVARKPLDEKTVAENVLEWGTGGINIDDSRIEISHDDIIHNKNPHTKGGFGYGNAYIYGKSKGVEYYDFSKGRYPANVIFDEEAGKILDQQSGYSKSNDTPRNRNTVGMLGMPNDNTPEYSDQGGASRFFYCPKASKNDRNEGIEKNVHPTVKPTDLMLYLIRLVTPKNGIVLDPFMGSGSTGKACVRGGFGFIGIELEEEYFEIAQDRIDYEKKNPYIEEYKQRKPQAQTTLDDW